MEFYPYSLFVSESQEAVFDEDGFVKGNVESFTFVSKCRDYATGGGNISHSETKEIVSFSSIICLPLSCPDVKVNSLIEVRDKKNAIRLKANIIRFERNQLHCRIWV